MTTTSSQLTGTYVLDPAHTQIGFVARHAMVTKVRGAFKEFTGTIHVDGDDPSRSSATITIKAASIDTRNEQRDNHLRSNDFLDVPNHPDITFTTTAVAQTDATHVALTGDLTIKGTSRSLTIPFAYQGAATDPMGNARIGFEGSVQINRKDWGVNWNATLETGGVLVSDRITLEFEISAVRQP
ncbi:polyisoprenoid-binding protein YceI [Streptacidiphilus sp. MAP12-33]|uniref:YceI family protein n=1 Tax=Streptacidiphilus sp. MAP12-33 TaxID=3156266 RepID=UPI003513D15F